MDCPRRRLQPGSPQARGDLMPGRLTDFLYLNLPVKTSQFRSL